LVVTASGKGFDPLRSYVANIDNNFLAFDAYGMGWEQVTNILPNATGHLSIGFIGAGFRPGEHVLSLYADNDPGGSNMIAPAAWAGFTVTTDGDPIAALLLDIQDDTALILTESGLISTKLADLQATIESIEAGQVTLATSIGTLKTSLDAIGLCCESVKGDVATLKTDLGTLSGKITSIEGNVATIKTDVGTLKTDISGQVAPKGEKNAETILERIRSDNCSFDTSDHCPSSFAISESFDWHHWST
jgi:hypothetical protein